MSPTGRSSTGAESEDEERARMIEEWRGKKADIARARAEEDAQLAQAKEWLAEKAKQREEEEKKQRDEEEKRAKEEAERKERQTQDKNTLEMSNCIRISVAAEERRKHKQTMDEFESVNTKNVREWKSPAVKMGGERICERRIQKDIKCVPHETR